MAGGRPTDYSIDLAAAICEMLANGSSLSKISKIEGFPKASTVYQWLIKYPEFSEMYARAREDQADTLADQITHIADKATTEGVQVARLRVDARKWIAAKLKPRKYGDKVTNEVVGADGGPVGLAITVGYKDGAG